MKELRRDREKSLRGEPVGHVADVRVDAERFLEHEQAARW